MRGDLTRVVAAEKELATQLKSLDDTLAQHSRITMTEDDFRRRIDIANERCNERIFENNLQNEHKQQQLRNALTKSEQSNQHLLQRLQQQQPQPMPPPSTGAGAAAALSETTNMMKTQSDALMGSAPGAGKRPPTSTTRSHPVTSSTAVKPVRAEVGKNRGY
jgi:hypothetical protein